MRVPLRLLLTLLIVLLSSLTIAQAQDTPALIIQLNAPTWYDGIFDQGYFADFYTANPGIRVEVNYQDSAMWPSPPASTSLEEHLVAVSAYAVSADVLWVRDLYSTLTPEATRAGFFTDLLPLASADTAFQPSDLYPSAWRAFQWEGGLWALPYLTTPQILAYDPAQFDAAGLTYPDETWDTARFIEAAQALTVRNESGNAIRPGLFVTPVPIIMGDYGTPLYDASNGQIVPTFATPALADIVTQWRDGTSDIYPSGGYSSEGVGLVWLSAGNLTTETQARSGQTLTPVLMPVNYVEVEGFAVSAGSSQPELAYQLARYLMQHPAQLYPNAGNYSALRGLTVGTNEQWDTTQTFPTDTLSIIETVLETGLSASDALMFPYVGQAFWQDEDDTLEALTAAQQTAADNLAAAAGWEGAETIAVIAPTPVPADASEIALNFGISSSALSNQQQWESVAAEFALSDLQVSHINIDLQGMGDYGEFMEGNDCYYLTYTAVDEGRVSDYLPLDPYLNTDPDFDPADLLPGILTEMQYGGQTWGYPLTIATRALQLDLVAFEAAGLPIPAQDWTVDQFANALPALTSSGSVYAFAGILSESTDLLMLMAAYSGLPLDYRTDPPTVNFDSPETLNAAQQVLDLARNDLIAYERLAVFNFESQFSSAAIQTVTLRGIELRDLPLVNYPRGTQYNVASYSEIGALYIADHAQNPDACYRWFATIGQHPELLDHTMPARHSWIDSPVILEAQGQSAVEFYRAQAALLTDPNTVIFPALFGAGGTNLDHWILNLLLSKAFDAYVLDGVNLTDALTRAQASADIYLGCTERTGADEIDCFAEADPNLYAEWRAASAGR